MIGSSQPMQPNVMPVPVGIHPAIANALGIPTATPPVAAPPMQAPMQAAPVTILGNHDMGAPVPVGSLDHIGMQGALNERPAWSHGEGLYKSGIGGVFQHLGDDINQPGMRAALLRSGAATLTGGLGAGIEAGAGYMDHQKQLVAAQHDHAINQAFETRKLDQVDNAEANKFGLGVGDLREKAAHDRATETVDGRKVAVTADGQRLTYDATMAGHAVTEHGIDVGAETSRANTADNTYVAMRGQNMSQDTSKYTADKASGTKITVANTARPAGIGSKANVAKVPSAIAKQALPLPATKDEMTDGKYYSTAQGVKQWSAAQGAFF
jgi:hypothetical protein